MNEYIFQSEKSLPIESMLSWANKNKHFNRAHSYYEARSDHILFTELQPGQHYPWHSDSHSLAGAKNPRCWTQIIYLTHGSPIVFGLWKPVQSVIADREGSHVPVPATIEAKIDPYPGLCIQFPSFYLHAVPRQRHCSRWTITTFLTYHPTSLHASSWAQAFAHYYV
jgi:hypothetical protein